MLYYNPELNIIGELDLEKSNELNTFVLRISEDIELMPLTDMWEYIG